LLKKSIFYRPSKLADSVQGGWPGARARIQSDILQFCRGFWLRKKNRLEATCWEGRQLVKEHVGSPS